MLENYLNNILNRFLSDYDIDINKINLTPLKGGKSSANLYQFTINDSHFVLRMPPANANLLTKTQQSLLAKQAGELGIGPKVCYIDPEFKGIVLNYIPGKEAKPKDFQNLFLIDKMANVLQKLHQNSEGFPIAVSPFERFNAFLQKNSSQNNQFEKIKLYMDEIEKALKSHPVSLCPTHLDLHLSNIILKNKEEIFLIDWVNGGLSDPFFDLATFSYFSELDEIQIERFLSSYFKRAPNEIEKARFNVILPVRIMVIAASFFSIKLIKESELYIEKSIYLIEKKIFKDSLKLLRDLPPSI